MPHKSYNQILDEHLYILIAQGSHEAYVKLNKRYYRHALTLSNELIRQYPHSGIVRQELIAVCEGYFPNVLKKYNPELSSFFSFWKESTKKVLIDYIYENSYDGKAMMFRGVISFDQNYDERHLYSEFLAEKDYSVLFKKQVQDIRRILTKYEVFFTSLEKAIINLVLEGYSLVELEHTGLLKKTQLYLTYNSALDKLHSYMKKEA